MLLYLHFVLKHNNVYNLVTYSGQCTPTISLRQHKIKHISGCHSVLIDVVKADGSFTKESVRRPPPVSFTM